MKKTTCKAKFISDNKITVGFISAFVLFFSSGYITDKIPCVTVYKLYSDKIESGAVRIVNISDLHNTLFGKEQSRLIKKLEELSPDIIVASGDIVNECEKYDNTVLFAQKASRIAPVYYASGNHERRAHEKEYLKLMDILSENGINVLNDLNSTVNVGENTINIIGVDDWSLSDGTFKEKINNMSISELYNVVLAHEPQYFEDYSTLNCELVLCGHEHGGQIRLPFIGGLFAPDEYFFPKYSEGEFIKNGTEMIVSRGLGNQIIFCPRFFNLPEIVCIDISSE